MTTDEEPTDEELFGDDPPMLKGMGPAPEGGWQVTTTGAHQVILAMADSMAKLLDDKHAANYVEVTIKPAGEIDGYLLTVQRPNGKSPHELRRQAEARVEKALQLIEAFDPSCDVGRRRTFIADLRNALEVAL